MLAMPSGAVPVCVIHLYIPADEKAELIRQQETLMPFTSLQCWHRDVHPRRPHHRALLQRLSTEILRQESERRRGWNGFKGLWWEEFTTKETFKAQKVSPPVFFLFLSPLSHQDMWNTHTLLLVLHIHSEPKLMLYQISYAMLQACFFLSCFL